VVRSGIEQITTKSPWSKEVSAHFARDESEQSGPMWRRRWLSRRAAVIRWRRYPVAAVIPVVAVYPVVAEAGWSRIGGMGGGRGGMGGPAWRWRLPAAGAGAEAASRRSVPGHRSLESAKPVLEALKAPLPDTFANHYVIGVRRISMMSGRPRTRTTTTGQTAQLPKPARQPQIADVPQPKDKEASSRV